eukprot:TRINITY_DN2424_c1_g1_i3.p1 TRINITY_DN2424_c1_g1~~TRINITY_DN2424_c1_g1_i3.p1  ORF type:complete len:209 (+),score=-7.04 TRINITY_DN2424_c1_g1_i3:55-627(+)
MVIFTIIFIVTIKIQYKQKQIPYLYIQALPKFQKQKLKKNSILTKLDPQFFLFFFFFFFKYTMIHSITNRIYRKQGKAFIYLFVYFIYSNNTDNICNLQQYYAQQQQHIQMYTFFFLYKYTKKTIKHVYFILTQIPQKFLRNFVNIPSVNSNLYLSEKKQFKNNKNSLYKIYIECSLDILNFDLTKILTY